ncbi:ABC transporter permease [Marinobacter caseinilyticus]|uniref:ABC transporter permease n=1 Tax=Marinobacter caseinilyticus TaxID=2692195 RepID=UPI00140DC114|nr:ABC transporter permease [Marinobacter caseinilyticus]
MPNRVVPVLASLALVLIWWLDFGIVQPNRIVPGTGYGLVEAIGAANSAGLSAGLLALMVMARHRFRARFYGLGALVALLLMWQPILLAEFADRQLPADAAYARTAIGAGFWSLLFLLGLMAIEVLSQLPSPRGHHLILVALVLVVWGVCVAAGRLDSLSLVTEYASRPDQFRQALTHHLALSLSAVLCSLVIAIALAIMMMRRDRWRQPVLATVSFLQTIPSLALFGLLIAPLSALSTAFPFLQTLGIRGIGWAPALLALVAYSLLPIVRNTYVALSEVPDDLVDAGRGMGMSERQLFLKLKLPLAMPIIIEGVRVTTIQAMGLTAVAALIGAGGFGTFIFQGLGQAAMDLVLLGALPTIALALAADGVLTALGQVCRPAGLKANG